jgi:hypothetical protein
LSPFSSTYILYFSDNSNKFDHLISSRLKIKSWGCHEKAENMVNINCPTTLINVKAFIPK